MWRLRMKRNILKFYMRRIHVCERIYGRAPEKAKKTEHWLCTQKERDFIYKSVQAKDKSGF